MDDYEGVLITETICPRCGQIVTPKPGRGRPPKWCSQGCRRAAYEERRAATSGVIATRTVTVEKRIEPSWDELVARVLSSPKATRKVLRAVRGMDRDGTLSRSEWHTVRDELGYLAIEIIHKRYRR